MYDFSNIACLDGRLFGVVTANDICGLDLNSCLRRHTLDSLLAANRRAESDLGYNLLPTYHVGRVELKGHGRKTDFIARTDMPGVAAINVKQEISAPILSKDLSPYIGTATLADEGSGYCVTTVSTSLVPNPDKITLRDNDGKIYRTQAIDGYPKRVGSDWKLAIAQATPCGAVSSLNIQHSFYMKVDIPSSTGCVDCHGDPDPNAQVLPVYPGTTDFIPLAKPIETVGSFKRYWLHAWTLIDPAFQEDGADLSHAEFYKLIQTVDFVCVREVSAGPDVYCPEAVYSPDDCATPTVDPKYTITIKDAADGLLHFKAASWPCKDCDDEDTTPIIVEYYYKTDPAVLGFELDLPNISTAIAYLAAANLPQDFCGCEIKAGFIYTAKQSQADARINPITGETIFVVKFGHTYGHYIYAEKIANAPKYRPLRKL